MCKNHKRAVAALLSMQILIAVPACSARTLPAGPDSASSQAESEVEEKPVPPAEAEKILRKTRNFTATF